MSLLTTTDIRDLMEDNSTGALIKWKNKQHHIQCIECNNSIIPANISMMYKCESIDTYTLYCICTNCVRDHLSKMHTKRTHDKAQAIKRQNRLQKFEHQNRFNADK